MRYQSMKDQNKRLSVTIYNDKFGLVKEERKLYSEDPTEEIQYVDVAKKIETDSIIISGIHVLELNFDFDLVSKAKLLEKYLDEIIYIQDKKTKEKLAIRLLSVRDGIIGERVDTKEIVINPEGELVLPSLPAGLIAKPALLWKVPRTVLDQIINVSYLTKGISWDANYVLNLNDGEFQFTGWVSINNQSGTTYENAEIKLIAGEINRVEDIESIYEDEHSYRNDELVVYNSVEPSFEEKSFADQHMYTLNRPITMKDEQEKQINFLNVSSGTYRKLYEVNRYSDKPNISIEIDNTKENKLEIPLPKGKVKVYEADSDNLLEFIGEDKISHIPKKLPIKITIGKAFDIVCEALEVDRYKENNLEFIEFHYNIDNHKEEAVTIKVEHQFYERDWEMIETSHQYEKLDSNTVLFHMEMKPDEKVVITLQYVIDHTIYIKNKK
ncbi:DUF4139 domain-containing protein [Evansella sp. AB-P1]|uniref:DUF4139 domain-containing protein n=1 Tax=Evansella sp. AB-P1 TaxID=3037653 RepID=UPI00241E7B82|nr:DUF4139 domain-containing protein [Evansella sp. AB-P1]MDG5789706.1 DUF4139 domain-containing protein [Evansella sp. AB-P1]